ncbi:MAG: YebC/PmpR family DNA-binding transcriptional regulator [Clostridiales bacterium]|jgi:YebC/PmpR family DNA-binding regulatory protein|nr:YebC/PmpR family DNA-binding transcriptional regulator [Clostridiales bacterium]
MSGHSKWNNIKRKKEFADSKRAKIFTKIGREIMIAAREGGANPESNSRLRDVIAKAKANNVPNDNISRMLAKASGDNDANYESMNYEGYGPAGIAVIVETMTDNKNRTAGDVRHYFDKNGGNLGATGCVSWQFDRKGVLVIDREDRDEDEFMMTALECGADDILTEDDVFEVHTAPETFSEVREALENEGFEFLSAEVEMVPQNYIKLINEDDIKNMERLIDMLEDNDDVQSIWHNWEE